ncbi:L,D-transpeptidase family protein [Sulfuriroseicoccus oceanibius]|uniref:L,D-transpeptidase family protein n=1 Tax=Sulfuriroseicoccus oceanibius TaxID=2707525 RepID=A0A6B3LC86_9BACT|nr:L,D-transpeptidase family protein [Sulfuriroseicoccus oceanibius]QQL44885.1 L,D-transpeptidase family protein [Sulfuriroseicoccus oceanibius]
MRSLRPLAYAAAILSTCAGLISCATTAPTHRKLAPGEYEWAPHRAKSGPLLVVVSIDDQMAYVYRNGLEIARSTVSTGRPGKETPTGVFTILQRKVEHESNIYKGAQMPYMQRLTWSGIAMHAGNLPGYPASSGCIRLPLEFSEKIYSIMENGSTVVITRKASIPSKSEKPASLLLSSRHPVPSERPTADPVGTTIWQPEKSRTGPVSILISYADRSLYVWRNGKKIGQAPIDIRDNVRAIPEGVFIMLEGKEYSKALGRNVNPWSVASLTGGPPSSNVVEELRARLILPRGYMEKLKTVVSPGTILLATREPSNRSTRSAPGFTIMKPQGK